MRKLAVTILSISIIVFLVILMKGVLQAASSSEKAISIDPTLYPYSVVVDSLHHKAYIASLASLTATTPMPVTIFDTLNDEVTGVLPVSTTRVLAVNETTHRLYVGNTVTGGISVFDTDTESQISTITSLPAVPVSIAVNETSNQIFSIGNLSNGAVLSLIDGETGAIKSNIQINSTILAMAVNPLKNIIIVASSGSTPGLNIIDGNSNSLSKTIPLADNVNDMAVDSVLNKIYITGDSSNAITAIDLNTDTILPKISIPNDVVCANTLSIDSLYHKLYASCNNGLTIIDTNLDKVLAQSPITGTLPATNAIISQFFSRDEVLNKLYIPLENTHQIGIIDLSVPPKIDQINEIDGIEGSAVNIPFSFADGNSSNFTITFNFGDGVVTDYPTQKTQGTLNHLYPGAGSYTVVETVTNSIGAQSRISIPVKIQNISPTVGIITASNYLFGVNSSVSLQSTFTDPGLHDTHKAIWNWGDDNSSEGIISLNGTGGGISSTHTYAIPGVYSVSLTVTDKDNASTINSLKYLTVSDSSFHSVFGSGEITSPAGAIASERKIMGIIKLGFYAKYLFGSSIATGAAEFNFQGGNIDFHSISIDALSVGNQTAFIKGQGLVNNAGNYTFALTFLKGSPDLIRLKITNNVTNSVVLDTQNGDTDSVTPKTIFKGSVLISP